MRHVLCQIVYFCSQLSAGQAEEQARFRVMAWYKKRVIQEAIDNRKDQLSVVDDKVSSRRKSHREVEEDTLQESIV